MLWLLAALTLAQPGECSDRSPGLSRCVDYKHEPGGVSCRAACYLADKPDGGTTGYTVKTSGHPSEDSCRRELQRQATNRCRP